MATLKDLRADLAEILGAGDVPAFPHLPERLTPPVQLLEPGSPYITDAGEDLTFGEVEVAYDVTLVVRPGTSAAQTAALDELVQTVVELVDATPWFVRDVEQPFALVLPDQSTYLATRVRVTTPTTLTT